ncbi:BTAD domain-containing putative transcriptional regulator [Streptomyces sp. NPDC057695]|uniref:AfsR/SARP family transcriptional regulator n=1 Tax=Streptomyces sp. NPDC057695 TaxID=3346217 RepID=UPI00369D52F9
MGVTFGLLGPVAAWGPDGEPLALGAPRHREVLGRLLIARGRVVPVGRLVADLWEDEPPSGAVGAVRTFVAALRRALEPDRRPRQPSRLLITDGPGYVLRADQGAVDAWRFQSVAARAAETPPHAAVALWDEALACWRGPVLADFPAAAWTSAERARLEALRLDAVERRADALLATGAARDTVADLSAHVAEHPGREDGWVLLITALDLAGRRAEALEALSRARTALVSGAGAGAGAGAGGGGAGGGAGRTPTGALARAEARLLSRTRPPEAAPAGTIDSLWNRAAAAWDRSVPTRSRSRLHATAGLLRDLAVTGPDGLEEARRHRRDLVTAAETTGDAELAARIIGSYDVPAVWTRADDPEAAAELAGAAARAVARLGPEAPAALRARLLSVMAVESRGDATADAPLPSAARAPGPEAWRQRAERAAEQAVGLARSLGDPTLLAFALNGAFMQSFASCGSAAQRASLGSELTRLAADHQLAGHEILGRIIRLQALAGLGRFPQADAEAETIDRLAQRNERPLARVFTTWYRALRTCETEGWQAARALYTQALEDSAGCGMPGLTEGAAALVALVPVLRSDGLPDPTSLTDVDAGPYKPWLDPLILAASGAADEAHQALTRVPRPPHDLLQEALWCVLARAAASVGHVPLLRRARAVLTSAEGEYAGAGSGLISFGPVARHLTAIDTALGAADGEERH